MPDTLKILEFSRARLPDVQELNFGAEQYERDVALWINDKLPGESVFEAMEGNRHMRIWLYLNQADELVGYGSLGETEWRLPGAGKRDAKKKVAVIPWLGVDINFQRKPVGEGEVKYSRQILGHLTAKAREAGHDLLGLFVHEDNEVAREFYKRRGFAEFPPGYKENVRMIISLALPPIAEAAPE